MLRWVNVGTNQLPGAERDLAADRFHRDGGPVAAVEHDATRRQLQVANLRQQAAMCGLSVQLRDPPGAAADAQPVAFYGRHRQRDDQRGVRQCLYSPLPDGAAWQAEPGPLPPAVAELLSRLPAGVSHVSEDLQGAGLFWDESGAEADVRCIDEVLKTLLAGPG